MQYTVMGTHTRRTKGMGYTNAKVRPLRTVAFTAKRTQALSMDRPWRSCRSLRDRAEERS